MQRSAFLFNTIYTLAFASFIAQFFIDFNVINISAACIVLASTVITLTYLRWSDAYKSYPVSSFAIFGLLVTTQLGAFIGQFTLWTSLTKDLRVPIETFSYLMMFQLSAVIAHVFYRVLANTKTSKPSILRYTLQKIGLYTTPSVVAIWVMGLIGLVSAVLAKGEGGSRVANGIQFVMWVPFLIPVYRAQLGETYCKAKLHYILLGLYTLVILGIGIAFNARGFMLNGIVTLGSVIFLLTLRSSEKFTLSDIFKIFLVLVFGVIVSFPLSDLTTAMAVARGEREKVSKLKLAQNTLEILTIKRELISRDREQGKIISTHSKYEEFYIDNPLLARFANTKFHDNMFYFGDMLNESQSTDLGEYTVNSIATMLPAPLLKIKWLGVDIDKYQYANSLGDYIVMLAIGEKLGGFKTGSAFGQAIVLFGFFAPFIYMLLCILLFYLKDLFSYKNTAGVVLIAPIGLFSLYSIFMNGLIYEGIQGYVVDVGRNFVQNILLYTAVFQFARLTNAIIVAIQNLSFKNSGNTKKNTAKAL